MAAPVDDVTPARDRLVDDRVCRVCVSGRTQFFMMVENCRYYRCLRCGATQMAWAGLPNAAVEYARYLCHQNDPADVRYRRFLARLAEPLRQRLAPGMIGLDYGCGPGPALAAMLSEAGYSMRLYDPFFYPDPSALNQTYDFITCTEVLEHFHYPARELQRLNALLRPGGRLGIMTCFQTHDDRFAAWHYRRDPTHVVFYRESTFHYLAVRWGWTCEIPCKDVVLMQKGW